MSEGLCLRWNQVKSERRQLRLVRTKNGDSRAIPLNTVALGALKVLQGEQTLPGAEPVFPSVRTGGALQGTRGWFSTTLEEAQIEENTWHCNRHTFASRLVMAGGICGRLQNCSGIGNFGWSCNTHISFRNTRRRQMLVWSLPRDGW